MCAHLQDAPPSRHERRAELPPAVDAVIARGMAKLPADRFPDCRAMSDGLNVALGLPAKGERPSVDQAPTAVDGAIVARSSHLSVAVLGSAIAGGIRLGTAPAPADPSPSTASVAALPDPTSSPSTTATPAPTQGPFPDDAEVALLAALPPTLAKSCVRGSYDVVKGEPTTGATSGRRAPSCRAPRSPEPAWRARLRLRPVPVRLAIKRFAPIKAADSLSFTTESAVSAIIDRQQLPEGTVPSPVVDRGDGISAAPTGERWPVSSTPGPATPSSTGRTRRTTS